MSGCKINYYHDYYIKGGCRYCYTNPLPIIETGEYQLVEGKKVVNIWIDAMVIPHTSATNCACLYH